jgi:carboxyl-terminal processing protease
LLTRRAGAGLAGATLVLGLVLGAVAGVFLDQSRPDLTPNWGRSSDQQVIDQAVRTIESQYYNRNLNRSKLSDSSLAALVQSLGDPFSTYYTPDEYRRTQQSYAGQYTGIGIYVDFRGQYPSVGSLIPGAPAEKAGLKPGDQLLSVNGKTLKGLTADQASALITGPSGSVASLDVQRGTQTLHFNVTRQQITAPFVQSTRLEGSYLYVRIYQFGTGTGDQLAAALAKGLPGSRGIVLDLRGNPGGFIDEAAKVISDFVTSGEAFELRDRNGNVERTDVSGPHPAPSIPLVVLVDKGSASASEIVAGSLRAHHRTKLVGQTTFGKGSVQLDFPLSNGGDLHLTIKHWFLPDGSTVQSVGLKPDDSVALPNPDQEFDVADPATGFQQDAQLVAGLKILGG